ncbi:LPS export ABC transporter periplasmic protein LptC [Persephonella sp.]
MKKNIAALSIVFLVSVFILNEINKYMTGESLSKIKYTDAQINDFLLIGRNSDKFVLKGNKLIEKEDRILIDLFKLDYIKDGEPFKIDAEKGVYFKNRDILKLSNNVKIRTDRFILETSILYIFTKKRVAKSNQKVHLYSENMDTIGKGLFINLKKEKMIIKDVRTVFRGI